LATPSLALYWHIGDIAIRLRAVTVRKVIGWNSFGIDMTTNLHSKGCCGVRPCGRI
jgi:hypothetical protein